MRDWREVRRKGKEPIDDAPCPLPRKKKLPKRFRKWGLRRWSFTRWYETEEARDQAYESLRKQAESYSKHFNGRWSWPLPVKVNR